MIKLEVLRGGGVMKLKNAKEVMQAFLDGKKLVSNLYGKNSDGDMYLYLSDTGFICEEDGAGAKGNRVDILFRNEDPEWEILE